MLNRQAVVFIVYFVTLLGVQKGFDFFKARSLARYQQELNEHILYVQQQQKSHWQKRTAVLEELDCTVISSDHSLSLLKLSSDDLVLYWSPSKLENIFQEKLYPMVDTEHTRVYQQNAGESSVRAQNSWQTLWQKPLEASLPNKEAILLTLDNGQARVYPVTLDGALKVYSPLSLNDGGFNPSQISGGLLLALHHNRYLPLGEIISGEGGSLSLNPFAPIYEKEKGSKAYHAQADQAAQDHWVLENEFLQLVITKKGGMIQEINLPFKGTHPQSMIFEAQSDRWFNESAPASVSFPAIPAHRADHPTHGVGPASQGGYYPLLRRPLETTSTHHEAAAFALLSDDPYEEELEYDVVEASKRHIVLEAKQAKKTLRRVYELGAEEEPYIFYVHIDGEGYTTPLRFTSGIVEGEFSGGTPLPRIKYRALKHSNERFKKARYETNQLALPQKNASIDGAVDWFMSGNTFFTLLVDPLGGSVDDLSIEKIEGSLCPSRYALIPSTWNHHSVGNIPGARFTFSLRPQQSLRIFAGPLAHRLLKRLDQHYLGQEGHRDPHYSSALNNTGWFSFIVQPTVYLITQLMHFLHYLTRSWAVSIILIATIMRLLLWPLNRWETKMMSKLNKLMPKLKLLQERYKDDPEKLQLATLELYSTHKITPWAHVAPLITQLPQVLIFSAVSFIFNTHFELRGASFIPGWIDDLTLPDTLFTWNYTLPFLGNGFHLLPLVTGGLFFIQFSSTVSSAPATPSSSAEPTQNLFFKIFMTLVLTFVFFYKSAAGLNLYFMVSTLLQLLIQRYNKR